MSGLDSMAFQLCSIFNIQGKSPQWINILENHFIYVGLKAIYLKFHKSIFRKKITFDTYFQSVSESVMKCNFSNVALVISSIYSAPWELAFYIILK